MGNDFYDPSFSNKRGQLQDLRPDPWLWYRCVRHRRQLRLRSHCGGQHTETENEDGTKTYTVTINDGLVWSDGTPITAKDYVFQLLLESSPEMNGVDGYPSQAGYSLVGYQEFFNGETEYFAGVHLVDEMTYSVTVRAEELPYHYDITYASAMPARCMSSLRTATWRIPLRVLPSPVSSPPTCC